MPVLSRRSSLGAAAALALLAVIACEQRQPEARAPASESRASVAAPAPRGGRELRLGRAPHLSVKATRVDNEALVRYLSGKLGQPVELVVPGTYDAVVEGLMRGEIDIAYLTPLSYVVAKERLPGLVPIVQLVAEGAGRYLGYVVTSVDRPIEHLAELRGKCFAFVDPQSTSGYLFPLDVLRRAGIEPERDFEKTLFAGSHPKVVEEVLSGRCDAGAIASTTFRHMRSENVVRRLRILAKTDWIPFDSIAVHPSLAPETARVLEQALLEVSSRTPEGRAVLMAVTSSNGFVKADDRTYDGVRAVARRLGLLGGQGATAILPP